MIGEEEEEDDRSKIFRCRNAAHAAVETAVVAPGRSSGRQAGPRRPHLRAIPMPPPRQRPLPAAPREIPQLTKGQEIIVQVTKEPVGKKGRSGHVRGFPGRAFPCTSPVRRESGDFQEDQQLQGETAPPQDRAGHPAGRVRRHHRTVAEGREDEALQKDLEDLIKTWREIEKTVKIGKGPVPGVQGHVHYLQRHPRPVLERRLPRGHGLQETPPRDPRIHQVYLSAASRKDRAA